MTNDQTKAVLGITGLLCTTIGALALGGVASGVLAFGVSCLVIWHASPDP